MAEYTYKCDLCEKTFNLTKPMSDPPGDHPACTDCGQSDTWRVYNPQVVAAPGNWPMASDAAGVGPHQVGEATKKSIELGVPTDFTPDGRAVFTSREHRKAYCKAFGLYDRNAGYGDQAPVNVGKETDGYRAKVPLFDIPGS